MKECLAAIASGGLGDPRSFLRQCVYVPESVSALKAFAALKASGVAEIVLENGEQAEVILFDLA